MNDQQLREAVRMAGTPCYVFDTTELPHRVRFLREHLPPNTGICYAMKANTFVLREISPLVDRLEICSPGELQIALEAGISSGKYVISGVNKDADMLNAMVEKGTGQELYTIESLRQMSMLSHAAQQKSKRVSVLLRLTSGNQFGMGEEQVAQIICTYCSDPWIRIRGIQYFSGTQKNSLKRLNREIAYLDSFLERMENQYCFQAEELEYGPGLPVAYFQGDPYDEVGHLAALSDMLSGMRFSGKVTLELGRSLVAACGCYLTRVAETKRVNGQNYAIVDGGIHQIVYYGQSMAMRHPQLRILPPYFRRHTSEWNIFGSLCTVNDALVKQMPLNDLRMGDVLVFEKTGAYCITEGIALFLSRELPAVVLLREDGTANCVRQRTPTFPLNTPTMTNETR